MTGFALLLVLLSAFIHASWNFALKRSGGGAGLITAACIVSLVVYAPAIVAVVWWQGYRPEPMHFVLMFASGMIHTVYFLTLDRAYRSGGDLSIVYPLARATGPLITIVIAILLLGERPSVFALAGAALIGLSAILLTGNPLAWRKNGSGRAAGFAMLTGCVIALYTVCDKMAVASWLVPPLIFDWGCNLFRSFFLVPYTERRQPGAIAKAWREKRGTILYIACLSPLSYIFVLWAMVFTPVSIIAPAREVSILFAAIMGAHFLREGDLGRRLVAAAGMVLGIAGLTLG